MYMCICNCIYTYIHIYSESPGLSPVPRLISNAERPRPFSFFSFFSSFTSGAPRAHNGSDQPLGPCLSLPSPSEPVKASGE